MDLKEVMESLEKLGSDQTKKTLMNHGARDPFYGVRIGDLKKLVKYVKKNQELALALYETGNSDAMYLAGLSVNPKKLTKEVLQKWAEKAYWYLLAEYTVASVTAESPFALELAKEWMKSEQEMIAACGWSTYSNYVSITPDEELDMNEIRQLLKKVEMKISDGKNRVRYTMNGFVISVGTYVNELHKEAIQTAEKIGKVKVNMGDTACKVPLATEYIDKVSQRNKVGLKRKTCIC